MSSVSSLRESLISKSEIYPEFLKISINLFKFYFAYQRHLVIEAIFLQKGKKSPISPIDLLLF